MTCCVQCCREDKVADGPMSLFTLYQSARGNSKFCPDLNHSGLQWKSMHVSEVCFPQSICESAKVLWDSVDKFNSHPVQLLV